jgi:hypothetical protein
LLDGFPKTVSRRYNGNSSLTPQCIHILPAFYFVL